MSVFQAILDSAQVWDLLRCCTERLAAKCGAGHHPGRRGPGCAGPHTGCGAGGSGPSPVKLGNCLLSGHQAGSWDAVVSD